MKGMVAARLLVKFMAWETRRREQGDPVRGSRVSIFGGIIAFLVAGGFGFILVMISLDERPTPWTGLLVIALVFIVPFVMLGLKYIGFSLQRIVFAETYFIHYKGIRRKAHRVLYDDIKEYKISDVASVLQGFGATIEEEDVSKHVEITLWMKRDFKQAGRGKYHLGGLVGLYELQEQLELRSVPVQPVQTTKSGITLLKKKG